MESCQLLAVWKLTVVVVGKIEKSWHLYCRYWWELCMYCIQYNILTSFIHGAAVGLKSVRRDRVKPSPNNLQALPRVYLTTLGIFLQSWVYVKILLGT